MLRRLTYFIAALALALVVAERSVAEPRIRVVRSGDTVTVVVTELDYPETLVKDLKSGLTTLVLVHVDVREAEPPAGVAVAETFSVEQRFDLWDEVYRLQTKSSAGASAAQNLKAQDDALSAMRNLRLRLSRPFSRLDAGKTYVAEGRLLLNPIEKERVQKIRQWIAQNAVTSRQDLGGAGLSVQGGASRFSEVFGAIFEQYTEGKSQIAAWQRQLVSAPFRFKELKDEKP